MSSNNSQYAPGFDWGTLNRWIDAGRPDLNADGTWDETDQADTDRSTR